MIKATIFDLDSCLSAANEPGLKLYQPVFDAIRQVSLGSHPDAVVQQAFDDMWRLPYDFVAKKYKFTPVMFRAGWNEFLKLEVTTPMVGYGDLAALKELRTERFLVTSGFRRLQESKVRALGIAPLFKSIRIDAIDEPGCQGKQRIFEDLLRSFRLKPEGVLIVGDNADSELAAGSRLGIRTVQTLRPGVPYAGSATYHVQSLRELEKLLTTPFPKDGR